MAYYFSTFCLGTSEGSEPGKLGLVKSQEEFNSSVLTDCITVDGGLAGTLRQTEIITIGFVPSFRKLETANY